MEFSRASSSFAVHSVTPATFIPTETISIGTVCGGGIAFGGGDCRIIIGGGDGGGGGGGFGLGGGGAGDGGGGKGIGGGGLVSPLLSIVSHMKGLNAPDTCCAPLPSPLALSTVQSDADQAVAPVVTPGFLAALPCLKSCALPLPSTPLTPKMSTTWLWHTSSKLSSPSDVEYSESTCEQAFDVLLPKDALKAEGSVQMT
mmetsp:Transcript_40269/g.99657  ORF Transcript_40269/g.99657 Transcript_40269/m.99657 type:complete len:200 (+) Transcript_40269:665-1264(+)